MSQLRPRFANTLATLSLTAAVALASATAVAQQPEHAHQTDHATAQYGQDVAATTPAAQRKAATDSTEAFINAHKQWAQASGASNKAATLQTLIAKAEARRELMAELIQSNPAEVLRVAIPEEKQLGMPAEVLEMLEIRFEVEGELEALYEDYEDGTHKLRHFLNTPFGERFELKFSGKHPQHNSGTEVRINGVLLDGLAEEDSTSGTMALDSAENSILTLAADGGADDGSNGGLAADLPDNTLGEQRTLVIMVNFQDQPENKPWTTAEARDMVFNQTNDFYLENSAGQTWLGGDVTGWYTLPLDSTVCDNFGISDSAKAAASAGGADLALYDRFIYLFPKNDACGYAGMANVGATPSNAWINGQLALRFIAHELGHNLGVHHARSLECGATTLGSDCNSIAYGDTLDVMGSPGTVAHFNAFQKQQLGWLGSDIITADTAGSYQLAPYETAPGTDAKALKILKSSDPVTGQNTWYYIEYRQAIGFDSFIADPDDLMDSDNVLNGVVIHSTAYVGSGERSNLLDMTPGSSKYYDWEDPALTVADSFTDPEAGVTITTDWTDSNGAQVSISFGQQSCLHSNPSISLTPGQSPWVAAGTAVTYSVTVTNNDNSACGSSSYSLSASQPSGWSASFADASLNLAPGASASTTLTVTSASAAVDGFYDIPVSTFSGSFSANGSVTYVVSNPAANTAPVAADDSASTSANTAVSITVLANDSDPDGDDLSITSTSGVNGTVVINANGSITFNPAGGFSGTEVFNYTISDGNGGSASASVSVAVAAAPATNEAPVAVNDSTILTSVAAVTIAVLGNDWDPEGAVLQVTATTQGAKGAVKVNADGTLTYTPGKRFKNGDSFSYTISDGAKSASATVNVQLQKSTGGNDGGSKGNGNGPNK